MAELKANQAALEALKAKQVAVGEKSRVELNTVQLQIVTDKNGVQFVGMNLQDFLEGMKPLTFTNKRTGKPTTIAGRVECKPATIELGGIKATIGTRAFNLGLDS